MNLYQEQISGLLNKERWQTLSFPYTGHNECPTSESLTNVSEALTNSVKLTL